MLLPRRLDIPLLLLLLLQSSEGRSWRGCEEEKSGGEKEAEELFKITLLHVNDIHSHFEEVNVNTGTCKAESKRAGKCYGGVSRMAGYIHKVRESDPWTLLLNAGDYYQGTMWYTKFQYTPVVKFSNLLNYTAMALGNHDFDDGSSGLQPFLDQVNYPVLAANLASSSLAGVQPSTVVTVRGRKVGIIGYVTEDTPTISQPGQGSVFLPVIQSVREEAVRLKAAGVEIIIATGHAGYSPVDLRMAAEVQELDLVVGGHSHTFLYTGRPPSVEQPAGPYPTYVEQEGTGRVVPVVQAYCYTKYMGHLELQFTSEGELVTPLQFAQPVLLDSSYPQVRWVESLLDPYRVALEPFTRVVGYSTLPLYKEDSVESSLGDLVADSMASSWPNTRIAFINDGGLRTSLEEGEITGEDLFSVLPFNNTVDRVLLSGEDIRAVLEYNVAAMCPNRTCEPVEFFQVAGLKVEFHIKDKNQGRRIARIEVVEEDGSFSPLVSSTSYPVAVTNFLMLPGKSPMADLAENHEIGNNDYEVLVSYLKVHSPLQQMKEGRIAVHYFLPRRVL